METRAHHVLIGLFTLLVVSAALIFALWLGKSDADRQFEVYDIVFQEAVSGLSKGGTVEFNGIKIGDVVSLRLDPEDAHRVIARVRVDSTAPVRSDTRARLVPAGITGLSGPSTRAIHAPICGQATVCGGTYPVCQWY